MRAPTANQTCLKPKMVTCMMQNFRSLTCILSLFLGLLLVTPQLSAQTLPPKPIAKPASISYVPKRQEQLVYLPSMARQQWQRYTEYRDVKAFAVSVSGLNARPVVAFSVANRRVIHAIEGALEACDSTAKQLGRIRDCEIFAIGDYVVFGAGPSYDRKVIAEMESIKSRGLAGRKVTGSMIK